MDKSSLRARMRAQGLGDSAVAGRVVAGLQTWMAGRLPGTAAAYLAMSDEVEVAPLFGSLPGWQWVLPRVEGDGTLTFRDRDVSREIHPLGMRQPAESGSVVPVQQIDLFLVPGLAFDRGGARLGRGGGYYDRILAQRRAGSVAVGVTTSSRVVDEVPRDPHDQVVDWLATEDGVMGCSPRS
jgi:5-formyltetrahydrofolate cyclo-ligase